MILLTVGTQFPFDRLVCAVDRWAMERDRSDIMAQIGPSKYKPQRLKCFDLIGPDAFRKLQDEARCMIAHAGMGSILTALEVGTPIIIMPRNHTLGEHRNAHQVATANRFRGVPGIYVVEDENSLIERLDTLDSLVAAKAGRIKAPPDFVARLRSFIEEDAKPKSSWIDGSRSLLRSRL